MRTSTFVTALAAASLATVAVLAGCDANRDQDPYADRSDPQTPAAEQSPAASNMPERDPADGSMSDSMNDSMDDSMNGSRSPGAAGAMPGETSTLAEADVVGQPVLSQEGEEIGTIAMMVEDPNGESEFAVVEVGEFLGIGSKQVAIDVRHLSLTADGKVQSNVTEDALQSMPAYQPADYEPEEDAE